MFQRTVSFWAILSLICPLAACRAPDYKVGSGIQKAQLNALEHHVPHDESFNIPGE